MATQNKAEGHRKRLREKFLAFGLDKFTDDEIIELLLTLGTPRKDCKQTARSAIKKFGCLAEVLEADASKLQEIDGIGPANIFGIRLIHSIARKFLRERMFRHDYLNSFTEALEYFTHALRDKKNESFHVLYLNSQNAILGEEKLSKGSPASVMLSPRHVIEKAFSHGATTLVLAHNHPGGTAEPSPEDIALTREVTFTARLLDICVRDHLIISHGGYFSFRNEGFIAKFDAEFEKFHKKLLKEIKR